MNPLSKNGNWLDTIKMSIPDHQGILEQNLDLVMTQHTLTEIEAHGCALAAATAVGNGELAFEIAMNGPLFGQDERQLISQIVVSLQADLVYKNYLEASNIAGLTNPASKLIKLETSLESKGAVYALAAALVLGSNAAFVIMELLHEQGYTDQQIQDITNIAAVVSAFTKVVI